MQVLHLKESKPAASALRFIPPLLVIILRIIIDHIEEPKLIDALRCRDHT